MRDGVAGVAASPAGAETVVHSSQGAREARDGRRSAGSARAQAAAVAGNHAAGKTRVRAARSTGCHEAQAGPYTPTHTHTGPTALLGPLK